MAEIIAILNRKGGVGKTTTAINLGKGLALQQQKVLLIDNDAQANLTDGLGIVTEDHPTLYHCYRDGAPLPIRSVDTNLDMVPASSDLETIQLVLSDDINRNNKLKRAVAPVKDQYDFIIIDCPPSLGVFTANALTCASRYIITAQAGSSYSNTGVEDVKNMIDHEVKQDINPDLECLGILITFFHPNRNISAAIAQDLEENYNGQVFNTRIRFLTKLMEAPYVSMDIFAYDPSSNAARDYQSLTNEVLDRVQHVQVD